MAEVTILREYSIFGLWVKSRIYANNKRVAKIGNCSMKTFSLPPGNYKIYAANPQLPIPYKTKKILHSNTLDIQIKNDETYFLHLGPHPLFFTREHYPGLNHLFTPVECLLLVREDDKYNENMTCLQLVGQQIQTELKRFKYHPITLILIVVIGLFGMVSNIRHPELYGIGTPWGFTFGISTLIGLFVGRMTPMMMGKGWDYKLTLYTAIGCLFMWLGLMFSSHSIWQSDVYFVGMLFHTFWAYLSFKRWLRQKVSLDKIAQQEAALEKRF